MREQYPLFESEQRRWAQRVWQALGAETQNRIIVLLAQMALARVRSALRPRLLVPELPEVSLRGSPERWDEPRQIRAHHGRVQPLNDRLSGFVLVNRSLALYRLLACRLSLWSWELRIGPPSSTWSTRRPPIVASGSVAQDGERADEAGPGVNLAKRLKLAPVMKLNGYIELGLTIRIASIGAQGWCAAEPGSGERSGSSGSRSRSAS